MDLRRVFASNLLRLRREKGLSQEELAHRADINRGYISTLETCEAYVGLEILGRIADVLGVEGADLLKPPQKGTSKTRPPASRSKRP
jgi:transcriptional regulator with XRE-family HTH domain